MSLSEKLAHYLIKTKGIEDQDQQEILAFGAEVLFGILSGVFITLGVGYVLGLHILIFYMLFASLMIRKTAGGAHSAHPTNCLIITVAAFNILALFARETFAYVQDFLGYFLVIVFLIGFTAVYINAPVESLQKPLHPRQRKILRKLAILSVLLISVTQFIAYYFSFYSLVNYAVSLVLLWQYLMLTVLGHKMILCLDNFFNSIYKGGETCEKN
ncbi:accessory gene regulator B [Desulforamulus putei DSM 12395]|uniref:Accessory gene regulator B n=1 Tax=Desulforamulus putei DSM 12395 TaxID=1121429 RepID=A0A1M4URK7_9FIRM|nr:accessory gene regulator B family protein [Desulforamulus putei]SHE59277.1 accessory gene regulator B [Desulforamulus putei DSM 12395]